MKRLDIIGICVFLSGNSNDQINESGLLYKEAWLLVCNWIGGENKYLGCLNFSYAGVIKKPTSYLELYLISKLQ